MENWNSIIVKYHNGYISKENAINEAKIRLAHLYKDSIAYNTLRDFIAKLEAK